MDSVAVNFPMYMNFSLDKFVFRFSLLHAKGGDPNRSQGLKITVHIVSIVYLQA